MVGYVQRSSGESWWVTCSVAVERDGGLRVA